MVIPDKGVLVLQLIWIIDEYSLTQFGLALKIQYNVYQYHLLFCFNGLIGDLLKTERHNII